MNTSAKPSVARVDLTRAGDWDRYVRSNEAASVYHLSGWRDVIESVFRRDTHYLAAQSAEGLTGILPLVRLQSLAFGDFLVSMPYVTYGGVLADDELTRSSLIEEASGLARDLGVQHMELRHVTDCTALPSRTDKVSMHLALCGDSEERWKMLGAKRRSQIKRPLREGAEGEVGGVELLADFYAVFALKYRDLGVPVYPLSWFRAVVERFPDITRVFVVRIDGSPVAASIVIGFNGSLEVPWAASLRSADRFGVNMYLYWMMVKYAEESGYRVFDFGRSTVDSGTWRFKKQWGAEPVQLYWHYWLKAGDDIPKLNPANPKYELAVAMWRRLPVRVANYLGPHIVKNLP